MSKQGVILVTGSCGRLGTAIVKRLGLHYKMVGFELLKAFYASTNEELVPCDLTSDESLAQALKHIRHFYGKKITAVIHLAAYYTFKEEHSALYDKITVEGTKRLLRGLRDFDVEQFIFSSTMLVHAPCKPGQKIDEEWPIEPKWAYPESKVKTEKIIQEECRGIPTVILRISGVYDDECHSIPLSYQIQRIFENQMNAHLFPGNITHGTDYIHIKDLVESILQCVALRKTFPKYLVLLIGEGKTFSYDFLQRHISQLLYHRELQTHTVSKSLAKMGSWIENHSPFIKREFVQPWMIDLADDHYDLDISRAKQLLSWTPIHSLEKSLITIINLLKHDPIAWYKKNGLLISNKVIKKTSEPHLTSK